VIRSRAYLVVLGLLVLGLPVAYWVGQARASGPPLTDPLYYSALLTDSSNNPVSGNHTIVIRVFDAATNGNQVCITAPAGLTTLTGGRFRVPLDSGCTNAVHANPDLWIEPSIDGTPFPRTKLGAVPYALEAGAVQFANVGGVGPTTEWPGAINTSRIVGNQAVVRDYPNPSPTPMTVLAAFINFGSSYTVGSISGPWLSGAPVKNSTGNVTLNLNSSYSLLYCVGSSSFSTNTFAVYSISNNSITTTMSNASGAVDGAFQIICVSK
jgi:hypothetical protein